MIEKGRISAMQAAILLYPTIMATAVLLVPSITGKIARQDMWLSPIWGSVFGIIAVILAAKLNNRFPKQTIIQYSSELVGKVTGKLIGFLYLFFLIHSLGIILREYGEFIKGFFLLQTPIAVIIGSMVLVSALAVRGGIEVMARSAQVFVPIVFVLFILIVILLMPEMDPGNLFPILENGPMRSLEGAIVPASWFQQFFLLSFMLPFMNDREKGAKWGMVSVIAVMFTLVISNLVAMFLFGNITSHFTYPVMEAARYISLAEFIQHMESVVMAIWVGGTFVKISVFYYVFVISLSHWLHLSDYRPTVLPSGVILTVLGIWVVDNLPHLNEFLSTVYPFYGTLFYGIIPVILLVVAMMRRS
ncbi:endospore germination permease [Virgibacillus kekensis]|uniref:Endospore germination permease n=1 Tax=Virgibacillus kekensis TaxID=202261 RepID=A0ABV9DMG3_9BACI